MTAVTIGRWKHTADGWRAKARIGARQVALLETTKAGRTWEAWAGASSTDPIPTVAGGVLVALGYVGEHRYLADAKHAAEQWVRQHAETTESPLSAHDSDVTTPMAPGQPGNAVAPHSAPNGDAP